MFTVYGVVVMLHRRFVLSFALVLAAMSGLASDPPVEVDPSQLEISEQHQPAVGAWRRDEAPGLYWVPLLGVLLVYAGAIVVAYVERPWSELKEFFLYCSGIVRTGLFLAAAMLIIFHTWSWLRTADWSLVTACDLFPESTQVRRWLDGPVGWLGLHKLVKFALGFPLWLWYLVLACWGIPERVFLDESSASSG